eukprot:m51a1_g5130 putative dna mismatch repair protein (366) ;mRNA; f:404085-407907
MATTHHCLCSCHACSKASKEQMKTSQEAAKSEVAHQTQPEAAKNEEIEAEQKQQLQHERRTRERTRPSPRDETNTAPTIEAPLPALAAAGAPEPGVVDSRELCEVVEKVYQAHPPEEFVIKGEPLNFADRKRGAEKMRPPPDDTEYDRHMEELVRVRAEMDTFRADMRSLIRTDALRWSTQQEATGGADADYDNADDPAVSKEVADNRLVLEAPYKALYKRKPPADWSVVNDNKTLAAVTQVLADTFFKCTIVLLGGDKYCLVFVDTGEGGRACARCTAAGHLYLFGNIPNPKSALLYQACGTVVLAQLGCMIPAQSLMLSLIDRIFMHIGASDNLTTTTAIAGDDGALARRDTSGTERDAHGAG